MVELKPKPVPVIILTVVLIWGAYRFWYGGRAAESSFKAVMDGHVASLTDGESGSSVKKADDLVTDRSKDSSVAVTKQNVLEFFKVPEKDGLKITWSHRTNSREKLEEVFKDKNIHMVEADVRMNNLEPVMAHDASDVTSSSLKLRSWLERFYNTTSKGIKLDIKETNAVEPSLKILGESLLHLKAPVWLNADVFEGPNGGSPMVDAVKFLEAVEKFFPYATLSVGWTTGNKAAGENQIYNTSMVEKMKQYCENIKEPLTFPVRASLVKNSLPSLTHLLGNISGSTLTVWHSETDSLNVEDLVLIRENFEHDQIYYDLPDDKMKEFLKKLSSLKR